MELFWVGVAMVLYIFIGIFSKSPMATVILLCGLILYVIFLAPSDPLGLEPCSHLPKALYHFNILFLLLNLVITFFKE